MHGNDAVATQLNSTYGALLNRFFLFGRVEMGASVTASGRQITTHMIETIGEVLTGERMPLMKVVVPPGQRPMALIAGKKIEPTERQQALIDAALTGRSKNNKDDGGDWNFYVSQNPTTIYSDTDSVAGDSIIMLNGQSLRIDEAEKQFNLKSNIVGDKHYLIPNDVILSPCFDNDEIVQKEILALYKHKVTKRKFIITTKSGKKIEVTDDHSIMVKRDNVLIEIKASNIQKSDKLIEIC